MSDNVAILGELSALAQLISGDLSETNGHFELDENITSIPRFFFRYAEGISSLKLNALSTGNQAFQGCTIQRVYLPKITSATASYTFQSCTNLILADFRSANTLGGNYFNGCSKLVTLILNSQSLTTLSNTNVFSSTKYDTTGAGGAYVYVPRSLISTYQTATNWATLYAAHSDMFRALEDYTVDGTTTGEFDETKL